MEEYEQSHCEKNGFKKAGIEIKPSPIHRYGVFATEDIAPKKLIEECPVIVYGGLVLEHREAISNCAFLWDDKNHAIALGCGSMYNHNDEPNATYSIDHTNQIIKFISIKHIAAGTEILVDYGKGWFSSRNNGVLPTQTKTSSSSSFRVIALLLFLLLLSKLFPLDQVYLSKNTKANQQTQALYTPAPLNPNQHNSI